MVTIPQSLDLRYGGTVRRTYVVIGVMDYVLLNLASAIGLGNLPGISTVGVFAKRYIVYWQALRDVCAEAFDCSARRRDIDSLAPSSGSYRTPRPCGLALP